MSRRRTLGAAFAAVLVVCVVNVSGLSPEEEHRLVMKADASVIDEKLKEMPYGVLMAPAPMDEHSLPVPTMDPPLPDSPKPSVQITTAAGLGGKQGPLSERIRNAMKTMKERMRTLQASRNRIPKKPVEPVKAPKFARPSTLITSNPSDLEVAMKRIEIMATRAGFNMSAIPRRSQLQIVSRLAPKLPSKMASAVQQELDSMSGQLYHYLPEPARDPLIEDDQSFLQHFMDQFDKPHTETDEFYKEVNSHVVTSPHKVNSFDVSQISLTDDPSHEPIEISESISSSVSSSGFQHSSPDVHLMPPKFDAGEGEVLSYNQAESEGVPNPSALISQYPTHAEETDPLITLSSETKTKSINVLPTSSSTVSRTTKSFKVGSVRTYGGSTNSPVHSDLKTPPTRVPPTVPTVSTTPSSSFEDTATVSVPPKPIRVSVISKDSIMVNDTNEEGSGSVRTIKYVHVEPLAEDTGTSFDKFSPSDAVAKEVRINPKEISVHVDKDSLPHPKPSQLTLDTYESTKAQLASEEAPTEDPYSLTDEEIAAAMSELKKAEAELNSLRQQNNENSLESDYPYRLLTPHPLEYPDHPDHPQPNSMEDDSDLVSHLDELLAEFNAKPTEETKATAASSNVQLQATVVPSPASKPLIHAHGHRRPHPLLKPRMPLRPGLGRPLMMGSRLRPLIRPPPAGFNRPGLAPSPPRINDVTVSQLPQKFNKECDYFSDDLCLLVQDYPIEAITEAMEQNPSVSTALLSKEAAHNQKSTSYMDGIPETGSVESEDTAPKHPDFAGEGGFLCPSKVAYGKIKKAKSQTSGDWKFVVNYGDKTQTLRLEKCLSPGDQCSYIMPHFRTACTQVYNYHRLLAWDSEKGLHMDVFKVPTCCTCHVLGFYVPGSKKQLPQTPALPMRRRDHISQRFMGPPRNRRISPHLPHHHRKPHPMMMMLPGAGLAPAMSPFNVAQTTAVVPTSASANTTVTTPATKTTQATEDEELRAMLLQYASLREKISKLKDSKTVTSSGSSSAASSVQSKRSSKLYSHWPKDIIKALRKRKRQSTISSKNNKMKKPSPEMLKKLKSLLTNSTKLENNPKLKQKIQTYLRKLKNSDKQFNREGKSLGKSGKGRGSRNMKIKLTSTTSDSKKIHKTKKGVSKADARKRLMALLSAAKKKIQDDRKSRTLNATQMPSKSTRLNAQAAPRSRQLAQQNSNSHPIWSYFTKSRPAQPPRGRRLRLF